MAFTPPPLSPQSAASSGFKLFRNLKIRRKILLGYVLTLICSGAGIGVGLLISIPVNQYSSDLRIDALEEQKISHALLLDFLTIQHHSVGLLRVIRSPEELAQHHADLQRSMAEFEANWADFVAQTRIFSANATGEDIEEATRLQQFIQNYNEVPQRYFIYLRQVMLEFGLPNFDPAQTAALEQALLYRADPQLVADLEDFTESLRAEAAYSYQEFQATEVQFFRAQRLIQLIFGTGLLISIIVALIMARYTSRLLAEPIELVTAQVHEARRSENFYLQVPVTSTDEVGALAHSFNDLMGQIAQYTRQLELARHNLEQRVIERTQALEQNMKQLQTAQAQLVQAEKLSSLGQLVAGVAHEINNPVNFIHGNLTHVRSYSQGLLDLVGAYQEEVDTPSDRLLDLQDEIDLEFLEEDLPKILQSMEVGTQRIREIVLSLRNFSRLDEAEHKAVNLHEGIDSTLLILQYRLKAKSDYAGIQIIKNYAPLPQVECYPGQLNQVFMNILANAIDALESRDRRRSAAEIQANPSKITITTTTVPTDTAQDTDQPESQGDRTAPAAVEIRFSDNGNGIAPEVQKHLFEPFFTTKEIGKGTGLGLSISHQVITEKHQGRFWCESTAGQGATFVIRLPLHQTVRPT